MFFQLTNPFVDNFSGLTFQVFGVFQSISQYIILLKAPRPSFSSSRVDHVPTIFELSQNVLLFIS